MAKSRRLGEKGIDENTTLVLYSGRNQYAIYGYWVTKVLCGHPDVRLLDGHIKKWNLEGRALDTNVPQIIPRVYSPQREERDDSSRVGSAMVRGMLGKEGKVILDARYHSEYNGERVKPGTGFDYGAERWGRIPGARHLFFRDLFNDQDDSLLAPADLEELFRSVGAAPDQADEVVSYCRLGHRASLLWFAATQLLYPATTPLRENPIQAFQYRRASQAATGWQTRLYPHKYSTSGRLG